MTKKKTTPQEMPTTEAPIAQNEGENVDLVAELAAQSDRYLRVLAEYDNYRKRSQKEKESLYSDAEAATVGAFLPILDNLERAEAQECTDAEFKQGIDLILKQFRELLAKFNVSEIEALEFDPEFHNAVLHIEDESLPENSIVQVLCKGYKMGERVIRHAMVQVAN